eukprot:352782-Chlamydomonas_euryale.AAC.3
MKLTHVCTNAAETRHVNASEHGAKSYMSPTYVHVVNEYNVANVYYMSSTCSTRLSRMESRTVEWSKQTVVYIGAIGFETMNIRPCRTL